MPDAPAVDSPAPAADATGVSPTVVVSATVSGASTATIALTGPAGDVAGESSYDPVTKVVGFTPAVPLDWTTSYRAVVTVGGETVDDWRFATADVPTFEDSAAFLPDTLSRTADGPSVQVGARFTPTVAGAVSGIRVYTGAEEADSRTGYLWGPDGTLLATVDFTGEASNGWRTGAVSPAVDLTIGAEYRVTVSSSTGRYARVPDGAALPAANGLLSSPQSAGVYGYGVPDQSSDDGFLVDVIFGRTP